MEWTSNDWPGGGCPIAGPDQNSAPAENGWLWMFRQRRRDEAAVRGTSAVPGVRSEKMARLEAVLFVAEGALTVRKLVQSATLADNAEARSLLDQLNEFYDEAGTPFRIERVATGYQLLTRPALSPWLDKLHQRQNELKLSSPAMETLTIVAYRQPITRADIEAVRGVQCAEMLKQLMERGLVRICGEDDSLGRPYLYDTTKKFLELFGLRSLDDLPMSETLRKKPEPKAEEADDTEPVQKSEIPAEEEDAESAADDIEDSAA